MNKIKNPTLILGLGGSGFLTVSQVKQLYKDYYQGELPTALKFLCIDFDSSDNNKSQYKKNFEKDSLIEADRESAKEWIKVSNRVSASNYEESINQAAVKADTRYLIETSEVRKNYKDEIKAFDLSSGAGQKRILGKIGISYPENYNKILNKLKEVIMPLLTVNIDGVSNWDKLTVHVVSSCSGGAGSGIFLDILFMLYALNETGKEIEIVTFNYLPDVFLTNAYTNVFKNLVEPNAYATLSELEYIYENHYNFRPTNFNKTLSSISRLPKANFLINQRSFGGANISYASMIYSCAKVIVNLNLAGNGLDSQWSNFQAFLADATQDKSRNFCSFGYAEIIFNPQKLEEYVIAQILKKSWDQYHVREKKAESNDAIFNIQNLSTELSLNFLEKNSKGDYLIEKTKVEFEIPNTSSKDIGIICNACNLEKEKYEKSVRDLLDKCFNDEKLRSLVNEEMDRIKFNTMDKNERDKLIVAFTQGLKNLKKDTSESSDFQTQQKVLNNEYQISLEKIKNIPRTYKYPWGSTKNRFWTEGVFDNFDDFEKYITGIYINKKTESRLIELWNKSIDDIISEIKIISNAQPKKLAWINHAKLQTELSRNKDNIINLEGYFAQIVLRKIEKDSNNINRELIEKFLSCDDIKTDEKEYFSKCKEQFVKCIDHLDAYSYVKNLENRTIYELMNEMNQHKKEMEKEQFYQDLVEEVTSKVGEVIHPLWDRQNDYRITDGDINSDGKLIKFKRVETPIPRDTKEPYYFGQTQFNISEGDTFNSHNKHQQVILELELGLAAFQIKNILRYKETFDAVIKDRNKTSVNYFAYSEIRDKILENKAGIFINKKGVKINIP